MTPVAGDVDHVVVLAGGDPVVPGYVPGIDDAPVIAADSGLHLARALGLEVTRVVGDLDSVRPGELAHAESSGAIVDRYPVDKDRTDLAIALDTALTMGALRITVVGGHGGRLDHLLGNLTLIASPRYAACRVTARIGAAIATVVHGASGHGASGHGASGHGASVHGSESGSRAGARVPTGSAELHGRPGDLVSLVPMHGDAHGVRTQGLRFPLDGEDLPAGTSRGVSNELSRPHASVLLDAGVIVAVQPGGSDDTIDPEDT